VTFCIAVQTVILKFYNRMCASVYNIGLIRPTSSMLIPSLNIATNNNLYSINLNTVQNSMQATEDTPPPWNSSLALHFVTMD